METSASTASGLSQLGLTVPASSSLSVEQRVGDFRQFIVGIVKASELVPHLSSVLHFNPNVTSTIIDEPNQCKAMHNLLDIIGQSDVRGKWRAFVLALKGAGYSYVASILEGKPVSAYHSCYTGIIQALYPALLEHLSPIEILPELISTGVLNEEDMEVIVARQDQSGKTAASMVLLDRIPRRLKPEQWYNRFLQALWNSGQKELVTQVDPDFSSRYTSWMLMQKSTFKSELEAAAKKGFASSFCEEYQSLGAIHMADDDVFSSDSVMEDFMEGFARLSVNFSNFDMSFWMSFAKQHGWQLKAKRFVLELCDRLTIIPVEDGLIHRPVADWSVQYLSCELTDAKLWLCSSCTITQEEELDISTSGLTITRSFFASINRVSYTRSDSREINCVEDPKPDSEEALTPTHNVQVYEMNCSGTKQNRSILLGLYDSFTKAQALRRNLSSEALKGFKVEGGPNQSRKRGSSLNLATMAQTATPSPASRLQTGHANSMLIKLVEESDIKSIAFTEEPSSSNMDQLHGVAACQSDEVLRQNWLIELHNSQMVIKSVETQGYVAVGAAKVTILSCTHKPVWVRNQQLRSKTTWEGSIECMQYYATVDPGHDFDDENLPWLAKDHVEDRSDPVPSDLKEMLGSGHSVGGVIHTTVRPTGQKPPVTVQLQRIISRCKCQFFYANYGEMEGDAMSDDIPLPPSEDSDMMQQEDGVDTFTLLHHDLNVCSNSLQFAMILDIVNNLLLKVETKKKEATEKLQNMRFQLQLSSVEDQKTPILQLQENVRVQMERLRNLEKELYMVMKAMEEDAESDSFVSELSQDKDELEAKLDTCKERILTLNEELTTRISCYKESQLQVKAQRKMTKTQEANVIRRNEVCFKFAQWRLTEMDGQLGIADLVLRNFVYTKVNRDNDTWSHQLELGWVKMTNLSPNTIYKDVLVPRDPLGMENDNRKMMLRILCTEKSPVGGIAVKEHFEVNVVPVQIQLTYQFYKTMMGFFFPTKDIDSEEDKVEDVDGAAAKKKKKHSTKEKKETIKRVPSFSSSDDIDKMRERAAKNNMFLYIKIPEVSTRVSYKGEKDKNVIDVHDFSLVVPTLEYHNCLWTWFDLLMAMKNDSKRALLGQAIKQKLHMRSRVGEETPLTDVQQEEDKAKMLLGAKLLAGQEKPAKKTLFGKSQK